MRPGSCGRAMGDTRLKVADPLGHPLPVGSVGELWAQGKANSAGYNHRPEETARVFEPDGWFRTGDLGEHDRDGYLRLVGRSKELIISGGYNVYPREVEVVLFAHPAVAEAAVIGRPDPRLGEEVVAFVVLKPGAEADPDDIIAYCRERLAAYKYPRQVIVVADLPKGPTGKILKRELRTG